jgi:hypothetical protein
MLPHLQQQCDARAMLFDPAHESAALHALVGEFLVPQPTPHLTV